MTDAVSAPLMRRPRRALALLTALSVAGLLACGDSSDTPGQRIDRTLQEADEAAEQMRRDAEAIAEEARREAEAMSRVMEESAEDALDRAADAMRELEYEGGEVIDEGAEPLDT